MARRTRATRILSEEERQARQRRRDKKKRFQQIKGPTSRGPQFIPFLLSILAIAVILFQLFGPKVDFGLDFLETEEVEGLDLDSDAATADESPDSRWDPTPFRDAVVGLETRLFTPDLADRSLAELGEELAADFDSLATRFRAEGSDALDTAATTLERESAQLGDGVDLRRLDDLRDRWTQLRGETFQPADWFQDAQPSTREQQTMLTMAAYRQAASDMLALVEEAVGEIELSSAADPADADEQAEVDTAWRDFATAWSQRHAELIDQSLPRPGAAAPDAQLLAIQSYEQEARSVASLVMAEGLPDDAALRAAEVAQAEWQQLVERFGALIDG